MRDLRYLALAAPLSLALGCGNTCGDAGLVSDNSSGTLTYVKSNAPKAGSTTTSGDLAPGLEIGAIGDGAFSVEGTFTDSGGQEHDFTVDVTDVSSGSTSPVSATSELWWNDCAPGDSDGACEYVDQRTLVLTGTIETESFITDCHGEECALTVVGTLHATASWGEASFAVDLTLNHHEVWQTFACSTNSNDSS